MSEPCPNYSNCLVAAIKRHHPEHQLYEVVAMVNKFCEVCCDRPREPLPEYKMDALPELGEVPENDEEYDWLLERVRCPGGNCNL